MEEEKETTKTLASPVVVQADLHEMVKRRRLYCLNQVLVIKVSFLSVCLMFFCVSYNILHTMQNMFYNASGDISTRHRNVFVIAVKRNEEEKEKGEEENGKKK